jgi:putative RNA 2'-phosphotransferase
MHTAISKLLSHALRHEPWLYELELDEQGWTPLAPVLAALHREFPQWQIDESTIAEMIQKSAKKRHELEPATPSAPARIRALYGHSLPTHHIQKAPITPPDFLFHGTAPETVPLILNDGLKPMSRHYVHLSIDTATALNVGSRKSKTPALLTIHSGKAHAAGLPFYTGNDKVLLADHIPPQFITAPHS